MNKILTPLEKRVGIILNNNQQQHIKLSKMDWMYIMIMVGLTILYSFVDGQSVL